MKLGCAFGKSGGLFLLWRTTRVLGILAAHGPRAFGEAFGIGLDGIELVV